ncbi:MAG: hypothetical protein AAF713_02665 [Pseudomonadota bacterium]
MVDAVQAYGVLSGSGPGAQYMRAGVDLEHVHPSVASDFQSMIAEIELRVAEAEMRIAQAETAPVVNDAINDGWIRPLPGPAEAPLVEAAPGAVLESLQTLREGWGDLQTAIADHRIERAQDIPGMMSLMMEVQQMSLTVNLVVQEVSTFTQTLSQMMKAQ